MYANDTILTVLRKQKDYYWRNKKNKHIDAPIWRMLWKKIIAKNGKSSINSRLSLHLSLYGEGALRWKKFSLLFFALPALFFGRNVDPC